MAGEFRMALLLQDCTQFIAAQQLQSAYAATAAALAVKLHRLAGGWLRQRLGVKIGKHAQ